MHVHLAVFLIFAQSFFVQNEVKELHLTQIGEIELVDAIEASHKNHFSEFEYSEGKIFYITDSPASLNIYSIETGSQIYYNRIQGAGPFEHQNVYNIAASNDRIHILGYTGKISTWTSNGEPIFEKETGITRAKDIAVTENSFVISHEGAEKDHHLFHTSKTADDQLIKSFGPPQVFENVLFSVFKNGGVLTNIDNFLYVVPPYGNKLWIFKSSTLEIIQSVDLTIPDFKKQKATNNKIRYFNDPALIRNFFENNSLVTGLYKIDNSFLLEVLHMHDNYKRELIMYNQDFTIQCHTTLNKEIDNSPEPKIRFSDGKYIYYYLESNTDKNTIKKTLRYYQPTCK